MQFGSGVLGVKGGGKPYHMGGVKPDHRGGA